MGIRDLAESFWRFFLKLRPWHQYAERRKNGDHMVSMCRNGRDLKEEPLKGEELGAGKEEYKANMVYLTSLQDQRDTMMHNRERASATAMIGVVTAYHQGYIDMDIVQMVQQIGVVLSFVWWLVALRQSLTIRSQHQSINIMENGLPVEPHTTQRRIQKDLFGWLLRPIYYVDLLFPTASLAGWYFFDRLSIFV